MLSLLATKIIILKVISTVIFIGWLTMFYNLSRQTTT